MDVKQTTEITDYDVEYPSTVAIVENRADGTVSIRTSQTDSDGDEVYLEHGVQLDDAMLDLLIDTLAEIRLRRQGGDVVPVPVIVPGGKRVGMAPLAV